jgi:hypothetical protein
MHPSGAYGQIFVTVRQLRVCWCGAPSLTRGRVCSLQLLLVLASAVILGSKSRGTHGHILPSQIWEIHQPGSKGPSIYNSRNRVAQLYPQALGSLFVAPHDSQGYGGGIRTRLDAGFYPSWLLYITWHGPNRKHRSYNKYWCRSVLTDLLLRNGLRNTVLLLRALPSNGRCLHSHRLETGLYITISFYCGGWNLMLELWT